MIQQGIGYQESRQRRIKETGLLSSQIEAKGNEEFILYFGISPSSSNAAAIISIAQQAKPNWKNQGDPALPQLIKSSNFANSSSIGVKYKDLKLGLSRNYLNSSMEANLEYEFIL